MHKWIIQDFQRQFKTCGIHSVVLTAYEGEGHDLNIALWVMHFQFWSKMFTRMWNFQGWCRKGLKGWKKLSEVLSRLDGSCPLGGVETIWNPMFLWAPRFIHFSLWSYIFSIKKPLQTIQCRTIKTRVTISKEDTRQPTLPSITRSSNYQAKTCSAPAKGLLPCTYP